jgi:hypothetical protein
VVAETDYNGAAFETCEIVGARAVYDGDDVSVRE